MDIVELTLDYLKDFASFEKMASEIMLLEGWDGIQPLGGVHDLGRDAIKTSYFRAESPHVTVFQYTIEKHAADKIDRTVARLQETQVPFHELVFVTIETISPKRLDDLKADFRKKYKSTLHIYERRTIENRLADKSNGIFKRYLPDIKAQLAVFEAPNSILEGTGTVTETRQLKSAIALVFGKGTTLARKNIFDHMVFAAILARKQGVEITEVVTELRAATGVADFPPAAQVESALQRLISSGKLRKTGTTVTIVDRAATDVQVLATRAETQMTLFADDIYAEVTRVIRRQLSDQDKVLIHRNVRQSLAALVRAYGFELAARLLQDLSTAEGRIDAVEGLVTLARQQLPSDIGAVVVAALSEAIRNPTEAQATILSSLVKAYLAVAIMGLDPTLNELQKTRFSGKYFILDTDVVLDAIIRERPVSLVIRRIIGDLLATGSRIVVPPTVVAEVVTHAQIATRTSNFFKDALHSLNASDVEIRVNNTFVAGYYYGVAQGQLSPRLNFEQYRENYLDVDSPLAFMREIITESLGKEVLFQEPGQLPGAGVVPADKKEQYKAALLETLRSSSKAEYRSELTNEAIAEADAQLFLSATYLNPEREGDRREVLAGKCYLVTNSFKYYRAARKTGMRDVVTTNPAALTSVLYLVGASTVQESDFVKLIHNPFLSDAVDKTWDDVQALVRNGVNLKGVSLPRLRWDLDKSLHDKISALHQEEQDSTPASGLDEAYINLMETAHASGYQLLPVVEAFRKKVAKVEADKQSREEAIVSLRENYQALETQIDHYEKRKKSFLVKRK
jgi:hypothetical protein